MKTLRLVSLFALFFTIAATNGFSQTQWKGVTSVNWAIATNWTNGVPTATTDVVIGDANFTGAFQPAISLSSTAKSLTIGGAVPAQLTVASTLSVKGNININPNRNIIHGSGSVTLTGDWINEGNYSTTSNNATVIFAGINQSLGGSVETIFRKLTINLGSILTLNSNLTSTGAASVLIVGGTLNPNESQRHSFSI